VSEQRIEELVRRYHEAFEARDVEKMLPLFAPDAVWISPVGRFEGTEGLRRVLTWDTRISPTVRSSPTGIGLLVKDNVAVSEMASEGTLDDGHRWDAQAIAVIEFNADETIQRIRLYYDKLSMVSRVAKQYTGVGGWVFQRVMNAIVARAEKGLHEGR
jgi:uncharacterized protein (TIGR02246 family)